MENRCFKLYSPSSKILVKNVRSETSNDKLDNC